MANRIRYGIIGCGSMGREHIENIKMIDGGVVTAIADDNAASREAGQALLPMPAQLFDNHHDLLAANLCDALVIATPNHTHRAMLVDAMDSDNHRHRAMLVMRWPATPIS